MYKNVNRKKLLHALMQPGYIAIVSDTTKNDLVIICIQHGKLNDKDIQTIPDKLNEIITDAGYTLLNKYHTENIESDYLKGILNDADGIYIETNLNGTYVYTKSNYCKHSWVGELFYPHFDKE